MASDLGIFNSLTSEFLRRIVIVIEVTCVLFGLIIYNQLPNVFFVFFPFLIAVHLLTLLALPSVFKKMNKEKQEELLHFSEVQDQDENLTDVDLWDRAAVGFYIVSNTGLIISIFYWVFRF
jgi:ABC-type bacteriocin/lantibiotic exporter with double-glycine peptidase domain